ncbi:MAG: hypothetical protein V4485_06360 [Pseudomonadota bacterium]
MSVRAEDLERVYDIGIKRTYWKSALLEKINDLRSLLSLEPANVALKRGEYDAESVRVLKAIDFSPLDTTMAEKHLHLSNVCASIQLNFCGIGFTPVEFSSTEQSQLLGAGLVEIA